MILPPQVQKDHTFEVTYQGDCDQGTYYTCKKCGLHINIDGYNPNDVYITRKLVNVNPSFGGVHHVGVGSLIDPSFYLIGCSEKICKDIIT